jgi:hypothetical protein
MLPLASTSSRHLRAPAGDGKEGGGGIAPRGEHRRHPADAETAILCRNCRHPVTHPQERIAMAGNHRHSFVNPAGLVFEIGCFRQAPGCRHAGPASPEFSWFPGYHWRIALCRGCQVQLGWRFESSVGGRFSGLILTRLLGP